MTQPRTRRTWILPGLLVLVLLQTGCGGGAGDSTTTGATDTTTGGPPATGDQALFMITYEGGFASPSMFASIGPAYVVTTDGRLIMQGPIPEIFPGPLVPNYQVMDVSDLLPDLEDILDRVGIAGITEEIDTDAEATVADASTTVLTYFDQTGTHRYGVYALGLEPQVDPADEQKVALNDLIMTLDATAFGGEPSQPYQSDRWQVVVSDDFRPPESDMPEDSRPYPLEIAVEDFEDNSFGLPCTVLEGDAAQAAAEAFADATQMTLWDTGSEQVQLLARPLLPGEDGCRNQ
ncbi:MAG: hypothetical protein ACR2JP_10025 [Acidimicrobiia bacterium]